MVLSCGSDREWRSAEIAAASESKKLAFPFDLFVTGHCGNLRLLNFESAIFSTESARPKHLQRIQESTASNAQQDYADGVVPEVPRNSAAMTDVGHG